MESKVDDASADTHAERNEQNDVDLGQSDEKLGDVQKALSLFSGDHKLV